MKDKRFLIAGTGKSGIASAELLVREGITPVLYDGNEELDQAAFFEQNPNLKGLRMILGTLSKEAAKEFDVLVLSPGISVEAPIVTTLTNAGATVCGEIELAYMFEKGKVLAITGTNGKTTTTSLLGEIMTSVNEHTFVVGNIGIPYTSVADKTSEDSVTVAEISSFQLETVDTFAPKVTAILNITPDHLDRHHSMENYIAVKESITKNQQSQDVCVLNYEDEELRKFGENLHTNVIFFSSTHKLLQGLYLEDGVIYFALEHETIEVISVEELNILGKHNYENVMAAVAMAYAYGVPMEAIQKVLKKFQAVEHRIEYVTEKRGVRFYNDSKGTNPDAAIQGIRAMNRPTCLIGGGYDKHSEYDEWIEAFDGKVKLLVLIGQTREQIADTARKHQFTNIKMADTLEEAVELCYEAAKEGDAVLLSPACASWGMFPNYEVRGKMFKEIVHNLKE